MQIERSRPAFASATAIVTATALSALSALSAAVVLGLPADRIGAISAARSDGFGRAPTDPPTAEPTPSSSPGPRAIHLPIVWRAARLGELPAPPTAPPPTTTDSATVQPVTPTLLPTPTVTPTPLPLPTTPLPEGCTDPLINGDFEARGAVGWIEQTAPGGSIIVAEAARSARSGRFGARIGAWIGGEEVLLSEAAVPTVDHERVVTLRW